VLLTVKYIERMWFGTRRGHGVEQGSVLAAAKPAGPHAGTGTARRPPRHLELQRTIAWSTRYLLSARPTIGNASRLITR
jgi:hypothetical protein